MHILQGTYINCLQDTGAAGLPPNVIHGPDNESLIFKVRGNEYGSYTCTARNSAGETHTTATLTKGMLYIC